MARDPKAEVEISAHSRNLGAKLREARAKFGTFGSELKKNVFGKDLVDKGFWGKAGAQMVGNLGASAVGGAVGILEDSAKAAFRYGDALTRLQITAEKTPEEMQAYSNAVRKASDETGIGKDKILAAGAAYVALTGDMDTAMGATAQWARVAQATNSSIDDISKVAAAMAQNMKIGPAEMEATFSALAVQGKKGAIELKDLAGELAQISPQWAMFKSGTGVAGVRDLGAALQIVKRGFGGDAAETVTGLQSLLTALVKNAGKFQKSGIKVFDVDPKTHQKTMRSVFEIVEQIGESKLMKDPTKLEKAFGRVEAYRAFLQLQQNKQALEELVTASQDTGVIQRDLNTYMQSTAGKTTRAWEQAKNKLAEVFTPARIELFANALIKVVEMAAKLVGFIEKIADKAKDVSDLVTGGGGDEHAEKWFQRRMATEKASGQKLNPRVAQELSRAEFRKFAALQAQDGGKESPAEREHREFEMGTAARMAQYYREQGDVWGGGGAAGTFDPTAMTKGYDPSFKYGPDLKSKSKEEYAQMQIDAAMRAMKSSIVEAIRAGLASGPSTSVNIDGSKVVDATRGAAAHARRPGA